MELPDPHSPFVILLGPPASGKSTVAATLLAERPQLGHFAVRRQFVVEKANDTDLWRAARPFIERSAWIPDAVVIESFARRMDDHPQGGMLIEGLPANAAQARLLRDLLDKRGAVVQRIIYLEADDDLCMARMRRREVCTTCDGGISQAPIDPQLPGRCAECGTSLTRRRDDEAAAFAERLRVHRHHITEIVGVYGQESVSTVEGTRPPHAVAASVRSVLASPVGRAVAPSGPGL